MATVDRALSGSVCALRTISDGVDVSPRGRGVGGLGFTSLGFRGLAFRVSGFWGFTSLGFGGLQANDDWKDQGAW